jgi:hypothetical protein
MPSYYFERALFVVGDPNAGKSTQLRSMFQDVRLGTGGTIPAAGNLPEIYRLSNERSLYLRMTSPHEAGECLNARRGGRSVTNFLDKTDDKITSNTSALRRRWNFACPLQMRAANRMPDVDATCGAFVRRFHPERTRVVFLSPDRHGTVLQASHVTLVAGLRAISSVEVSWIDARDRTAAGLLLADFFDFA